MQDDIEPMVSTFAALADCQRLRMMLSLATAAERSVGDLARGLAIPMPAASQGLAILRLTGLVSSQRRSNRVFYRTSPGVGVEDGWLVIRTPRGEVRIDLSSPAVAREVPVAVVRPRSVLT